MTYDISTWANGSTKDQMSAARAACTDDLRDMAVGFNWTTQPEPVLAWILGRPGISLATATTAFFNADPERFNYVPHAQLPETLHATTRLLDWLCDRINMGGYADADGQGTPHTRRIRKWLDFQRVDQTEQTCGRWVFLPERLTRLMTHHAPQNAQPLSPCANGATNTPLKVTALGSGQSRFQLFDWRETSSQP